MKKFCYTFVMIVMACLMVFTGCSHNNGLGDNPATNASIVGNGGYAVVKGEYLYYTNGFVEDYQSVLNNEKTDNVFGEVTFGAIYRTKLSNYALSKDSNGFLKKTERVVPKVVGFENGGFYIIGDYIYYATPHMEKESGGKLRNDLINFNRIKIDGTGNKSVYVSDTTLTTSQWRFYGVGSEVYLVVAETKDNKTTLKSISINSKGKTNVKTLATDVTSYALYDGAINNNGTQNIYFTTALSNSSLSGNALKCVNIKGGDVTTLITSDSTYGVIGYANDSVYYTVETDYNGNKQTEVFSRNVANSFANARERKLASSSYKAYLISDYNENIAVAVDSDGAIRLLQSDESATLMLTSGVNTLVDFAGNYVFYLDSSNKLKKLDVTTDEYVSEDVTTTDKTLLTSKANYIDVNGSKQFVFAEYTASDGSTHYYLNMITDGEPEFVGSFANGHTPAKPDNNETTWIN